MNHAKHHKKDIFRVALSSFQIEAFEGLIERSTKLTKNQKEKFFEAIRDANGINLDVVPIVEDASRAVLGKPIPWKKIFDYYLGRYGEAHTALLLSVQERVVHCIAEGYVIPSPALQTTMLNRYANDTKQSIEEVLI